MRTVRHCASTRVTTSPYCDLIGILTLRSIVLNSLKRTSCKLRTCAERTASSSTCAAVIPYLLPPAAVRTAEERLHHRSHGVGHRPRDCHPNLSLNIHRVPPPAIRPRSPLPQHPPHNVRGAMHGNHVMSTYIIPTLQAFPLPYTRFRSRRLRRSLRSTSPSPYRPLHVLDSPKGRREPLPTKRTLVRRNRATYRVPFPVRADPMHRNSLGRSREITGNLEIQ